MVSDALGHWGCGAYHEKEWFQLCWAGSSIVDASIAVKELIPLVAPAAVWGKQWTGSAVMCKWDNQSAVAAIMSRTSHDKSIMHLLRCLFFFEVNWDWKLVVSYIPGIQNDVADDLSRNHLLSFLQKMPTMSQHLSQFLSL